jgi:hypothetical protein
MKSMGHNTNSRESVNIPSTHLVGSQRVTKAKSYISKLNLKKRNQSSKYSIKVEENIISNIRQQIKIIIIRRLRFIL